MRFVCDSCRAQYMISDEKVGPKGVKVRCKKCSYVILVKKADGSGKAPVSSVGADADDALATQVMQNPLTGPGETQADVTNPGLSDEKTQSAAPGSGGGFFSGVDEDEIGAVFDQVLNSGAHSLPKEPAASAPRAQTAVGSDDDDRLSTRVLDAATVKQLAKESGDEGPISGEAVDGAQGAAPAATSSDWFAAIDDKQTGPLSIEKLHEHWSKGEIGPDSLAWKAGMPDWIPISEIPELAGELSPRSTKPVVIAPTPAVSAPGNVVSMPVESAFSAGAGLSASMRGEMQVPLGTGEDVASWRPSAASALASLVKEEMDALSKPAPSAPRHDSGGNGNDARSVGGLIDLPSDEERPSAPQRNNGHSDHGGQQQQNQNRAPVNPYMQAPGATYSSPAIAQYRPPPASKNPLIFMIAGAAGVLVLLLGTIIYLVARPAPVPQQIVMQQPAPAPTPAPVVAAPVQPAPVVAAPAGTAPAGTAPAGTAPAGTAPAVAPTPVGQAPVAVAPTPVAPTPRPSGSGSFGQNRTKTPKPEAAEKPVAEPNAKKAGPGEKDDFDEAFGDGPKAAAKKEKPAPEGVQQDPKRGGYPIPPAPGGGADVKDALTMGDIAEVVVSNKPAIQACVAEQKKKDPSVSGKLTMKWTIQTNGKTSNVSCSSDEFKSTYMASCLGGLIKGWTFPKHKKQGDPVLFPFTFK